MAKNIALLFGSFNPIHIGHLIIAETVASDVEIDEVWLIVSPQNPFKEKKSLLNQYDRLHLATIAIENNYHLRTSNIEFGLPQPSYTIDTLTYLKEKYPDKEFTLIMGEDNLVHFDKWKNYEQILKYYNIIVYPRINYTTDLYVNHPKVKRLEVPYIGVSATDIRTKIKNGQSFRYLVPEVVYEYIVENGLYK